MPLHRRTLLTAIALAPLATGRTAARHTDRLPVDWRATVGDGRLLDTARAGDATLLLTTPSGEDGTAVVHAVAEGSRRWSRRLERVPDAEAIAGTDDGGFLVAGLAADETVAVARLVPDRTVAWHHRVPVGYHEVRIGVQPLADDRVAVVSNDITTHAVSARLQCLDASGTVHWDHTRDAFGAIVTDTVDGDLVAGGYAYVSEFGGWVDRIAPDGERVWERRWPEDTAVASFGPGGGVAASTRYRDDGPSDWRIRYLDADGTVAREWTHNVDDEGWAGPVAATRFGDGGALFLDESGESGGLSLLRTGPDGSPDSVTVAPFDAAVAPLDVYPVDGGVLVAGGFAESDAGGWVLRLAESTTPTRTTERWTDPATTTGRTTRQTTDPNGPTTAGGRGTTTGEAGPGFGPLAALVGVGAAAIERLRRGSR